MPQGRCAGHGGRRGHIWCAERRRAIANELVHKLVDVPACSRRNICLDSRWGVRLTMKEGGMLSSLYQKFASRLPVLPRLAKLGELSTLRLNLRPSLIH